MGSQVLQIDVILRSKAIAICILPCVTGDLIVSCHWMVVISESQGHTTHTADPE